MGRRRALAVAAGGRSWNEAGVWRLGAGVGLGLEAGLELASFGEEVLCVESAGGLILMLEVDVGVAMPGEGDDALGEGVELDWGVAAVATEAEADVGGSRVDLGGEEIVAFGNAEGGIVLAKYGVNLVGEPGGVAELEGDRWGVRGGEGGRAEELLEADRVGLEVGWQLKEEAA